MKRLTITLLVLIFTLGCFGTSFAANNEITVKREFLPGIKSADYGYFSGTYMESPPWANQDGIIKVKNAEGKFGFLDMNGNTIADYQFEEAGAFSEGLASVGYRIQLGDGFYRPMSSYIDTTGNLTGEYANFSREDYSEGYAVSTGYTVSTGNGKSGYINTAGELVIERIYDLARPFKDGYAAVRMNGKFGFIDKSGTLRVECKYDRAEDFSEDRAAVQLGNKWAYIDKAGNLLTGFEYDTARSFSDGMAVVGKNDATQSSWQQGTYGYIDKSGKLAIGLKYKVANDFSEGLASVSLTNRLQSFYIDKNGNKVIDKNFSHAGEFKDGYAYVSNEDTLKFGFINRAGQLVVPYAYDNATNLYDGKALAQKDGKCYMLEINKTPLIEKQKNKPINIMVGGKKIEFSNNTGYPFIDNAKRTATPIRAVLEAFGATVEWNGATQTVTLTKGDTTVEVPVDARYILVNGERQYMDSSATIVGGRTYLPIRAVIEAFGGTVAWDAANNRIGITE